MLLDRFISRSNFSSYEDFYKNFRIHTPSYFNFAYDVVDVIAKQSPEKKALVWCDEKGNERIFTFADIRKYSSRAAHFFKACGVTKGDKVLLLLKRRYEFWFCLVGLHRIGAACVPASQMLTAKDIVYRNNSAGIKMIVAFHDLEIIQHVEEAEAGSPALQYKVLIGGKRSGWKELDLEHAVQQDYYERPTGDDATDNQDCMLIYFTSGTTGLPKMVSHNFTYPLGHIVTAKYWQCVQDDKLHLTLAETGWAKAMWGKIYGQWLCGGVVFVYDFDRFSSKNLLHIISRWKVATFCAPPTVYRMLFEEDFTRYDLSSLEYCSIAGEAYDRVVFEEFHKRTGLLLKEAYGQTETTVVLGNFPWIETKPCSMGKPAPGYMVELLNETGESCKTGEKGEIAIRVDDRNKTIGLFSSYHNDPAYTASVWHDGFYFTGDIAWRDADGYYWFVGRSDNMIKSSGYRIGPFEVESVLLEHPAVRECVVTGVPDLDRGQAVKATIVLNENYQPGKQLIKELQDYVKTITAPYKYPRFIEFANEFMKTDSGKINRPKP
jgi:acetyl-CoA synthetase